MVNIDCLGDMCPIPILKLKEKLKSLEEKDSILLVTDHSCVLESIKDYLKKNDNYNISSEEVINGIWEIKVSKK